MLNARLQTVGRPRAGRVVRPGARPKVVRRRWRDTVFRHVVPIGRRRRRPGHGVHRCRRVPVGRVRRVVPARRQTGTENVAVGFVRGRHRVSRPVGRLLRDVGDGRCVCRFFIVTGFIEIRQPFPGGHREKSNGSNPETSPAVFGPANECFLDDRASPEYETFPNDEFYANNRTFN